MTNGENAWGVSYSRISWLEKVLGQHDNVAELTRERDILFSVVRAGQQDTLKILCCDEYTMGVTKVLKGIDEFGRIDIFYVGGNWCAYTQEAKQHCLQQSIGLYNASEMAGALWKNEYWDYQQKDEDGNPIFHYR